MFLQTNFQNLQLFDELDQEQHFLTIDIQTGLLFLLQHAPLTTYGVVQMSLILLTKPLKILKIG